MPTPIHMGDATITPIHDGTLEVPGDRMFKDIPRSRWFGWFPDAGAGRVTVPVVVVLVAVDGELMLFDTGLGQQGEASRRGGLAAGLAALGHRPSAIHRVLISHAHGDHIWGALDTDGRPAFPNVRYHVARLDWDWLLATPGNPGLAYLQPLHEAGRLVLDAADSQLTPSVRSLASIGHSPGHRCLLVSSGGGHYCFLGDLTHYPPLHFAEPDLVTAFDSLPHLTPEARRSIARQAVAGDWLLGAAHAPAPALGRLTPLQAGGWQWRAVAG